MASSPRQPDRPRTTPNEPAIARVERSPEELATLLADAAVGDERAWRQIVDAYVGRVFSIVRSQCGDADLAEEITQSTFCTVAVKLRDYQEVGKFESWLFRIAMNRLRDEMRRRKRHASPMAEAPMANLAVADEGADAPGRRGAPPTRVEPATSRALLEAIASLNEADREIVTLRHVGGLSFKQLADSLNEPLGTLLARHHRALKKLREYLEERGVNADGL
jgi:RNA polymerase sigma-70 factor (ECF subfamily)